MTKPLSRQIFEACGYEPKKVPCPHKGCRHHISHPCEVCHNRRFVYVFPDLQNNNDNFANLLELKVNHKTLLNIMFENCYFDDEYIFDRTNNLKCILGLLEAKNSNDIKQAIRQADWSY